MPCHNNVLSELSAYLFIFTILSLLFIYYGPWFIYYGHDISACVNCACVSIATCFSFSFSYFFPVCFILLWLVCFYFILFCFMLSFCLFVCLMPVCFLMKEGKGVDLSEQGDGEDPGVEGGKMYYEYIA